jgi:hypothetical protein
MTKWRWHLGTIEGTVQQLALQPSPQPESSLPLIGQTFHLIVFFALLSSHQLTLQIEKDVGQPKRSKERNSDGVNGLSYCSASLFFKPPRIQLSTDKSLKPQQQIVWWNQSLSQKERPE